MDVYGWELCPSDFDVRETGDLRSPAVEPVNQSAIQLEIQWVQYSSSKWLCGLGIHTVNDSLITYFSTAPESKLGTSFIT
jgi:hypothetical protein